MRNRFLGCKIAAFIFLLSAVSPWVLARGTDLTLRGSVVKVEQTAPDTGTVTVHIVGFDVPLEVTPETDIESHGDLVGLAGLSVGDFVKVQGFFSPTGIVAKEIQKLDAADEEFRLRGSITKVATDPDGKIITLLGIDVLVTSKTKIERRGPQGGFTLADLVAGMQVDTRGTLSDGRLVASRLKVGNREDEKVRIRFEGQIAGITDDILHVDTKGGGMAGVLVTDATKVKGTPTVGKMIEVKGTLNEQLLVVAETIKVDGEGDPPKKGGKETAEMEKEIRLKRVDGPPGMKGEAKISFEADDEDAEQEFEVEIEKAAAGKSYEIFVEISGSGVVSFGTMTANSKGSAKAKFKSGGEDGASDILAFLPSGKDVRDFLKVQVKLNGSVQLEGSF